MKLRPKGWAKNPKHGYERWQLPTRDRWVGDSMHKAEVQWSRGERMDPWTEEAFKKYVEGAFDNLRVFNLKVGKMHFCHSVHFWRHADKDGFCFYCRSKKAKEKMEKQAGFGSCIRRQP